jgi:hypothetical protein
VSEPRTERDTRRHTIVVWGLLVVATLVSWTVGIDLGVDQRFSTVVVMLVTFLKVFFVGRNFMELRAALIGTYLAAS